MVSPKPAPKRRLPVVNSPSAEPDEAESRRPWQWVGFGVLAIFTVWIPLAALAGALAARLPLSDEASGSSRIAAGFAVVGVYAVGLGLGAGLGGFLVGRWGPAGVGPREAALSGLGASAVAVAVTWLSFGPSAGALLVAAVAAPMAALGGRAGLRARVRRR
jgi:hypothetical protein